jgi:hypothetical protein
MIVMTSQQWFELAETCLDDSTGPIDEPEFDVVIDDLAQQVRLTFVTPQAETAFCLRWIK